MEKYYIVTIQNILNNDNQKQDVMAIEENNELFELLTNQKIYMVDNGEFNEEDYLINNYNLIGVSKIEVPSKSIAKYLFFLTDQLKIEEINVINEIAESIKNSLKNSKKVLKLQKNS